MLGKQELLGKGVGFYSSQAHSRVSTTHSIPTRPIYARAAKDNMGPLRGLRKMWDSGIKWLRIKVFANAQLPRTVEDFLLGASISMSQNQIIHLRHHY
jgi:hypothetical protein